MAKHGKKKNGMLLLAGLLGVGAYLVDAEKKASAATGPQALPGSSATTLQPNNHPSTTVPTVVITGTPGGTSVHNNGAYPITAIVATQTDPLRIRDDSSLQAHVLEEVPKGSQLFVEGPPVAGDGTQTNGWAPVLTPDGTAGFASMDYLNVGQ